MNASQVAVRPVAPEDQRALDLARSTLAIEVQALQSMADRLNQVFAQVVQQILRLPGRVVVMGMGKSGHVGRKLAATLASTGTPAFFVHPAEASHGDLGMVTDKDLVLALSNSGESDEITSLLSALKRQGVGIVAMTGGLQSTLARHADWVLDTSVEREACPLNLAPTASTTAQLALGDALAVALLDARGFRAEDFARSHPGGSLGRKLLTHVADVMRSGSDVPAVQPDADFSTLMREMGAKGLGVPWWSMQAAGAGHLHRRRSAPLHRSGHRAAHGHGRPADACLPQDRQHGSAGGGRGPVDGAARHHLGDGGGCRRPAGRDRAHP
jgi:arabinose-5-phosphate isomerase